MKKILIVIDMQNDFISGSLANAQAQAIVSPIAALVKTFDGGVLLTRDTHGADYLSTPEGKKLPIPHCIEGTEGWQVAEEIAQAAADKPNVRYLDKPTFGCLDGWELDGVAEALMVGTCTDICVVSNALILKAKYPALKLSVDASLCAGLTPQKHDAALETMQSCQIEIVRS